MTVSNNTEAYRALVGAPSRTGQPAVAPMLAAVTKATAPGEAIVVDGTTSYVLVDSRRFSQYQILSVDMEHIYGSGDADNPTIPTSTTSIQLFDTTGMSFFNLLMDLFRNKLQTTRGSAFFLLAIMFTGHRDDGRTETISTCFIPLMLLTSKHEFDTKGSMFEMMFFETEGGRQDSILSELSIKTICTPPTLGGALGALEKQLNAESLDFYQKYISGVKASDDKQKTGKLVQYMITLYDKWENYATDLAAKANTEEQKHIAAEIASQTKVKKAYSKGGDRYKAAQPKIAASKYVQFTFGQTSAIPDAIKQIMESSTELKSHATKDKREKGTAVIWKQIVNISSDDNSYVVHFDIVPFQLPAQKVDEDANKLNAGSKGNVLGGSSNMKNVLHYDYIFTGRNSHITNLKLEYSPESSFVLDTDIDIGRPRFRDGAQNGQTPSKAVQAGTTAPKAITNVANANIRANDPVPVSWRTPAQQTNMVSQQSEEKTTEQNKEAIRVDQEYRDTLGFAHFMSSIELDLTIRGNPKILSKYADKRQRGIAPHPSIIDAAGVQNIAAASASDLQSKISTAKGQYYSDFIAPRLRTLTAAVVDGVEDGPDVTLYPLFVKLNILAPNVDTTGDYLIGTEKNPEPLFTDKFFFNGPYMVLFIKTSISQGEFSHNLSLVPYDTTVTGNDEQSRKK